MGPCISAIPVRIRINDNMTASELLSNVQDQYLAAIPFETVGLQTIVQECINWHSWEDLSTVINDLSEENFLDRLDETIPFDGSICTATVSQNPGKWTDIAVETRKEGNQMHARLYFSGKVFRTELVEDFVDMLVVNVRMLSSRGDSPIFKSAMRQVVSMTQFSLGPGASSRIELSRRPSRKHANEKSIV